MKGSEKYFSDIIPAAIECLRKRLGMNQWQFAQRLGTRESNVSRWEAGKAVPGGAVILEILRLCPDADSLATFGILHEGVKSDLVRKLPEGTTLWNATRF